MLASDLGDRPPNGPGGQQPASTVQAYAVLFESTGEVKNYAAAAVARCDVQGNEV